MNQNRPTITPIQIIGTQRSGSNLLRLILNQAPEISAHHPPHILKVFFPILDNYGELNKPDNFRRLIHDVCRLIETNPVPWNITLDRDEVLSLCSKPTLVEVFKVLYELMAQKDGASFWCCKSMANVSYFEALETNGLAPLYIHLIRDGRDVAASFKKTIVGEKHVYHLAQVWKNNYQKAKRVENQVGIERCLTVKYEQLISAPAEVLNQLNAFLGIQIGESALEFFNSEESKVTAAAGTMWQNLTQPILSGNTKKFMSAFTPEEIAIFERVAGAELEACGYARVTPPNDVPFTPEEIETFRALNESMKREVQQAGELEVDRLCRVKRNALLKELHASSGD